MASHLRAGRTRCDDAGRKAFTSHLLYDFLLNRQIKEQADDMARLTKTIDLQDVEDAVTNRSRSLSFGSSIEKKFEADVGAERCKLMIRQNHFGILIYHAFLFSDYGVIYDVFTADLLIHFVLITPLALAVNIMLARNPPAWLRETLETVAIIILAASIVWIATESHLPNRDLLEGTILLVILFATFMQRLRFKYALAACVAAQVFYSYGSVKFVPFSMDRTIMSNSILLGALVFSLFGAYSLEREYRTGYLLRLREKLHADNLASRLNQQQALLSSILDTGPDAMILFDAQGTIASFSRAAEQMFGWDAPSVVGQNLDILMTDGSRTEHARHFIGYTQTYDLQMISKSSELDGRRRDGSVFPMILHIGEVLFGGKRQFTGIIHDLTPLREAHDRSQDLRTQLAHVWSMNSLGEMAAILAHELNQPLSAIANYLQGTRTILVHQENLDDDLLEAVDQAGAQALRAGEIIRRMRSLIAQKNSHHRQESLKDVISEIDFMIRLVAREADVTVQYDFAAQPDLVIVDRIQIQQVVSNLARNACEAMSGHPRRFLDISTRSDGRNWTVSVDDSGPGIAPEISDRLFVPLATSKTHGMGLGLTVSRAIIRHHKGELWVGESRRGGSSFGFTIPTSSMG